MLGDRCNEPIFNAQRATLSDLDSFVDVRSWILPADDVLRRGGVLKETDATTAMIASGVTTDQCGFGAMGPEPEPAGETRRRCHRR